MIKKWIIALILLICVISGSFAVMSYYNATGSEDPESNSIIDDINNDSGLIENSLITYVDNYNEYIDDDVQYTYGYIVNANEEVKYYFSNDSYEIRHYFSNNSFIVKDYVGLEYENSFGYVRMINGELRHYVNKHSYYLECEGIPDTYIQCAECGGYIPIGPITKPIPSMLICHKSAFWYKIIPEEEVNNNNTFSYDYIFARGWAYSLDGLKYPLEHEHEHAILIQSLENGVALNESTLDSIINYGVFPCCGETISDWDLQYFMYFISKHAAQSIENDTAVDDSVNSTTVDDSVNSTTVDDSVNGTIDSYPHEGSENYSDVDDFGSDEDYGEADELVIVPLPSILVEDGEDYLCS